MDQQGPAGAIAHDLNNLLTTILSYSELALRRLASHPAAEDVEQIHVAALRAVTLTRDLVRTSLPAAPSRGPTVANGVVLLVEDEEIVRRLTARVLSDDGYEVLEARNGLEALAVAAAAGRIDLLLTDLKMPGMGGRDLARQLQRDRPGLRVLFVSGYAGDGEDGAPADAVLLDKPFTPEGLMARVREALSDRRR